MQHYGVIGGQVTLPVHGNGTENTGNTEYRCNPTAEQRGENSC